MHRLWDTQSDPRDIAFRPNFQRTQFGHKGNLDIHVKRSSSNPPVERVIKTKTVTIPSLWPFKRVMNFAGLLTTRQSR